MLLLPMPFRCLGFQRSAWAASPQHAPERVGDALLAALHTDLHVRVGVVAASHEPVQPQPAPPCLSHPRKVRPLAQRGKRPETCPSGEGTPFWLGLVIAGLGVGCPASPSVSWGSQTTADLLSRRPAVSPGAAPCRAVRPRCGHRSGHTCGAVRWLDGPCRSSCSAPVRTPGGGRGTSQPQMA